MAVNESKEFDAREVEALALALDKAFNESPGDSVWDGRRGEARMVLAREARLVEALESIAANRCCVDCREAALVADSALAAHRAATAPSEPTLEQAVDALLADAQCTGQPTLKCVDADKLAALRAARERATGGRK